MIPLPKKPKLIEKKENFARFVIEGLYSGYGITIGNALRRVLLSSMEGAAVYEVKINGVQHEFSTIPGVLEDVVMICLNLKKMRFKLHSDEPVLATCKVKGETEVTGASFKLPSQLELVNKDVHIATLTNKNASLEMEILVKKGIGYEPVEDRKEKLDVGRIALDAIYTPVKKVSYRVENMRVGERTDFDRLFIDIETDSTIEPEEVFKKAADILIKHFSLCLDFEKKESKEEKQEQEKAKGKEEKQELANKEKPLEKKETTKDEILHTPIDQLALSVRTLNALSGAHIKSVSRLLSKTEEDLLALEGLGKKGVEEIKEAVKKLGLELKNVRS